MKTVIRGAMITAALALVFAAGAWAIPQQQPAKGQGQQQQPAQPQTPGTLPGQPAAPAGPTVSKEEADAFKAFYDMKEGTDPQAIPSAGEAFLKKYPESPYREAVYARLTQAYLNADQVDKMTVAGEKALELNPNNHIALSVLSFGILRRGFKPDDLDAEQKLEKVEKYAKHGIELINTMPKPEAMTEEAFVHAKNEGIAMCNSGLGLAYLHRQRYADSIAAFEKSTTVVPNPDPTDLYLLASLYEATKRYADAATAFERCGATEWAWQDRCKQGQAKNKKLAAIQGTPPKQ